MGLGPDDDDVVRAVPEGAYRSLERVGKVGEKPGTVRRQTMKSDARAFGLGLRRDGEPQRGARTGHRRQPHRVSLEPGGRARGRTIDADDPGARPVGVHAQPPEVGLLVVPGHDEGPKARAVRTGRDPVHLVQRRPIPSGVRAPVGRAGAGGPGLGRRHHPHRNPPGAQWGIEAGHDHDRRHAARPPHERGPVGPLP